MKSKKDENEKKEKGGGGEAAARENLETSGTQFAKIAHQLFSHLLEFKVCFQERRSIHIREGRNTTSFAKKPIQSFLNGWDDLTSTKRSFFNGWDDPTSGNLFFRKNYPIFSKTLCAARDGGPSSWSSVQKCTTVQCDKLLQRKWIKRLVSTCGSWRHLFLC